MLSRGSATTLSGETGAKANFWQNWFCSDITGRTYRPIN
jgi:hypothetical protein